MMWKRVVTIGAIVALPLAAGCSRGNAAANPVATDSRPGSPQPGAGGSTSADASGTQPAAGTGETRNPISKMVDSTPEYREVTMPAGTVLPVELQTTVSSDTSHPEEHVRARVRQAVTIDGYDAVPAGSTLSGVVTDVRQSGRVKGRAHVALRFSSLEARDEQMNIRTDVIARTAPATKKADATKIGIGAGAGAIVGGIVGGGSGAAKGAAIGGAGGTGYVLATRGKPVSLPSGTALKVKLLEPITLRVPLKK